MLTALGLGLASAAVLYVAPNPLPATARPLVAWDIAALSFIAQVFWILRDDKPEDFSRRAGRMDEGRHLILLLCVAAAAVSIWAILAEFGFAKDAPAAHKGLHIALALVTVAISWTFTHTVFASHYAHEFYGGDGKTRREGLKFPGKNGAPNWTDFVHFAFVIGAAAQTADVQIESRTIRHTATWHGIIALLFNTAILALAVNLAASQF